MEKKIGDAPFIKRVLEGVEGLERSVSKTILKLIYNKSNKIIRADILKRMEKLGLCDEKFLFSVLEKGGHNERKQALLILTKNPRLAEKGTKKLLAISNPFGIRTRLIKANLKLIDEVRIPQAEPYLAALAKYRFFWNRSIREKSKQILRKL